MTNTIFSIFPRTTNWNAQSGQKLNIFYVEATSKNIQVVNQQRINFYCWRSQWTSVFDRFVKTSGLGRSLLYISQFLMVDPVHMTFAKMIAFMWAFTWYVWGHLQPRCCEGKWLQNMAFHLYFEFYFYAYGPYFGYVFMQKIIKFKCIWILNLNHIF